MCSPLSVIKEIQTKTTGRYDYEPAKIKKMKRAEGNNIVVRTRTPGTLLTVGWNIALALVYVPHGLAIPLSGVWSTEIHTHIY